MQFGHAYKYVKDNQESLLTDMLASNLIALDIMVLWELIGTYPPNWEDHNKRALLDHVIRYLRAKGQLIDKCPMCGEPFEEELPFDYLCANCLLSEALKACAKAKANVIPGSQFLKTPELDQ